MTEDGITYQRRKNRYFREISRDFAYGKDIRLYNADKILLNTQQDLNKHMYKEYCKSRNKWIQSGSFTNFLELIREGVMYLFLVYSILFKGLGIGNFTLYVGAVRNFARSLQSLLTIYARMRQCSRETNDYRTLNEFCEQEENDGISIPDLDKYEFTFVNVSFKYPGSDNYVLKGINITIEASQKLAIVGLNGARKTTFIKLLMRLYELTEGNIYLNKVDIKRYNRKEYYKLFSPVFQDMECYAFSLAENISLQIEENTDKLKAEMCIRNAGLGNKLDEWAKGIDTQILKILYDDGVQLSGGEKQKMSLARALYKDAPVVVLDEPTAALDAMAESKMYEDFDKLVQNKTSIYISHRLASTRFCDAIALFNEGEIIEYGSHNELLSINGKYAEMFDMQAQYYKETNYKKSIEK